jgi:ribosomal protein S18 acetylase RimI-like enzyme
LYSFLSESYLRAVLLSDDLMPEYLALVEQDYADYYFFIYDVLLQPKRTKVWLAVEGSDIVGLMLVYNDCMVQLRGCPEAVGFLLSGLCLENAEVQAPRDCQDMVLARYPVYKTLENVTLMRIEKGKENLKITVAPERLSLNDADELAGLMRETYPVMWSEMTGKIVKVLVSPKEAVQYGIRVDGRLAAFGTGILTGHVGVVSWLGTLPQFRGRGFCRSLISVLVREGLKKADFMAIHVFDENEVPRRLYESVGFRPYRQYVFVRT